MVQMKESKDILSLTAYYAVQAFKETGFKEVKREVLKGAFGVDNITDRVPIGFWENVRLDGKIVGACDVAPARILAKEWQTNQPDHPHTRIKRINLRKVPMSTWRPSEPKTIVDIMGDIDTW